MGWSFGFLEIEQHAYTSQSCSILYRIVSPPTYVHKQNSNAIPALQYPLSDRYLYHFMATMKNNSVPHDLAVSSNGSFPLPPQTSPRAFMMQVACSILYRIVTSSTCDHSNLIAEQRYLQYPLSDRYLYHYCNTYDQISSSATCSILYRIVTSTTMYRTH